MHIAIVTPHMIIGGAETYIIAKSQWLINRGYQVTVISDGGENVKNLPDGVEHVTFQTEVSPLSFVKKKYDLYLQKLSRILTNQGIDIIEAHNTSPLIHVAQSYQYHRIPFLINILNELTFNNPVVTNLIKKLSPFGIYYTLANQMLEYAIEKSKSPLQCTILPIPVAGVPEGDTKNKDDHYLLSVSRMAKDKMYVLSLIDGFTEAVLKKKLSEEYQLHIVGDGDLFGRVKQKADKANQQLGKERIKMPGTLTGDVLWDEYRNCSLYVGTGTSLLLGASCRKPILIPGYTTKSMPYAWGVWGERPEDKEVLAITEKQNYTKTEYADMISILLVEDKERAKEAGKKAFSLFSANYNTDHIMEQWEREYAKIIATFVEKGDRINKASQLRIGFYRFIYKIYKYIRQ